MGPVKVMYTIVHKHTLNVYTTFKALCVMKLPYVGATSMVTDAIH